MTSHGSWHLAIWNAIMEQIHQNLEEKDFEIPTSVVRKTICTQTKLLAVSGCPARTDYFDKDTLPTESCPGIEVVQKKTNKTTTQIQTLIPLTLIPETLTPMVTIVIKIQAMQITAMETPAAATPAAATPAAATPAAEIPAARPAAQDRRR